MSSKFKKSLLNLGFDNVVILLTGSVAIGISILDLLGWLQLSTENLIQISVAAIGILMTAFVLQSGKQDRGLSDIVNELNKSLKGKFEIIKFAKDDDAFKHMARSMNSAERYVNHVSLYKVPRQHQSIRFYEEAYERVILNNDIRTRYIADLSDPIRQARVSKFLSNPKVERYIVRSVDTKSFSHPAINFMIIDGQEVIFAIPGYGEQDTVISVKNPEIIQAFEKYFDLIWSNSQSFDSKSRN